MDIVEKLASEDLLTDEQVERIGRNVSEMMKAAEENPALLKEALEKMGFGAGLKAFGSKALGAAKEYAPLALGYGLVGTAMGAAGTAGGMALSAAKDKIDKARSYRGMLEDNPQLQNADPNIVQKAFNTLHRFNPEFAKDPLVAGTFVQNVVDQERLDIGTVKSLVEARRSMSQGPRGQSMFQLPPPDMAMRMREHEMRQEMHPHQMERARMDEAKSREEAMGNFAARRADQARMEAEEARAKFWREAEGFQDPGNIDVDPTDR